MGRGEAGAGTFHLLHGTRPRRHQQRGKTQLLRYEQHSVPPLPRLLASITAGVAGAEGSALLRQLIPHFAAFTRRCAQTSTSQRAGRRSSATTPLPPSRGPPVCRCARMCRSQRAGRRSSVTTRTRWRGASPAPRTTPGWRRRRRQRWRSSASRRVTPGFRARAFGLAGASLTPRASLFCPSGDVGSRTEDRVHGCAP